VTPDRPDYAELLARFRPSLIVLSGEAHGLEFVLDQRRSLIGRGPGVDLALDHEDLETEHAVVEFTGDAFLVARTRPDAHLVLNGAPIERAELKPGDRIDLGPVLLAFELEPRR
jgi:hypothetical protein